MFEKFFRAEGASRETPGTGLGLAVTKSLVEVMGGMIEMQSKLGEGSRFSFSLPKQAGDQKEKTNEFS
jgi:two-component system sensor histidine kinase TorS